MQKQDLHDTFDDRVSEFEKYRGFVEKASAATDRFRAEVIAKVVADNETKAMEIAGELMMIVGDVEGHMADLGEQKSEIDTAAGGSRMELEELELRLAIGDLEQDAYDEQSKVLSETIAEAEDKIATIELEADALGAIMARWQEAGTAAKVFEA